MRDDVPTTRSAARVACVDVPALPLQLLLRERPEWADAPLAVVEADHPTARIQWVDARAHKRKIRVGMRYAAALQLSSDLRAAPVAPATVEAETRALVEALYALTPRVEAEPERPGVLWLDPSGMAALYGPLERWAAAVFHVLRARKLEAGVVVGFARLPAWVLARAVRGVRVLASRDEERELADAVPLASLAAPPGWVRHDHAARTRLWAELRDALLALGIGTVGELLALPRGDVGVRFGPAARELHALLGDALRPPMEPVTMEAPLVVEAELEPPDDDLGRLLFSVKGALHALMGELGARGLALGALTLTLRVERGAAHQTRLEPASPTRDALALLELVRLRLAGVSLKDRVERLVLEATPVRLDGTQLALFAGRRRDPEAAARGIARLRAAFGSAAVTRLELREAWLPEDRFALVPTDRVEVPRIASAAVHPDVGQPSLLCRRMLATPTALPVGPDGRPRVSPPITQLSGPYRLETGWWHAERARDYFYGEREDGAVLWLYRERGRGTWFVHGWVE